MIRRALALALAAASPAAAAPEGGAIRGGEHPGFTRLVMQVDPTTEWSLETEAGRATIRFPGKPLPSRPARSSTASHAPGSGRSP